MISAVNSQREQTVRLDRSLEYAAVQSWDELMPDRSSGLIHIEYQSGCEGSLDFLKVWTSVSRGEWRLVCETWMRPLWSNITGLSFSNGYEPVMFAHAMKFLTEHEGAFSMLPSQSRLIQIFPPTPTERQRAHEWMDQIFGMTEL
jgi:hypothetical protein